MKRWIVKVGIALLSVIAFPGAVLGVLAAQGRLRSPDVETFRRLPVVGALLPAASEAAPEAPPHGKVPQPSAGHAPVHGAGVPSDLAAGDRAILEELRARRAFLDQKLDRLEQEREELGLLRTELEDREEILRGLQRTLAAERAELDRDSRRLEATRLVIEERSLESLKKAAKTIAEMDTEKAAEALAALDEDQAARLLWLMDATAAGSVFSEMKDAERRRSLLERYSRIQMESSASTGGK